MATRQPVLWLIIWRSAVWRYGSASWNAAARRSVIRCCGTVLYGAVLYDGEQGVELRMAEQHVVWYGAEGPPACVISAVLSGTAFVDAGVSEMMQTE